MFLYKRTKSYELRVLHCLKPRMDFSEDLEKHFNNLIRGFEGEQSFEILLNQLSINSLILPDLCLASNQSFFQIDTLFFTPLSNYLFEVKNYKGV